MKTILITGGAGFFGTILKKEFIQKGYFCVSIDLETDYYQNKNFIAIQGDIRNRELLECLFQTYQFDAIFHCAAMLAHDKNKINELWSSNVDGTQNIADLAEKYQVPKIIFISSNCLWAQNFDTPVKETAPPNPIEIYGKSKWEGEKILLAKKDTVPCIIFRSPTIMDEGRLGLLAILFEFIDENRKIPMVGDGTNIYQFIYAKDFVKAFELALDYPKSEIFNIGSDHVKTFNEVYEYVIQQSGSKSKLRHYPKSFMIFGMKLAYKLGLSPLGPYQYKMIAESFVFNTEKIKKELGFKPTLTNEEMLLKSYLYFHNNRDEIKTRKNVSAHNMSAKMGVIKLIKWLS